MRVAALAVLLFLSLGRGRLSAQPGDTESLKAAVMAETKAYYNRDLIAWQNGWVHEPNVSRTLITGGSILTKTGWDKVSEMAAQEIKNNPEPYRATVAFENFTVRQNGDIAWVEYEQVTSVAQTPGQQGKSHEKRLMVKSGGTWKIASQVTIGGDSLEDQMNGLGYRLLDGKKPAEAIEIFKTNVRLYPESWNAYDSLGEAYAAAGQKELAIQAYEKSVQLNPKSTSGKAALEKLKSR